MHGYSPYQLVFGQNPNLPSVLIDEPPALEDANTSSWISKNITVLRSARKAFAEAERSERTRRALHKQLQPNDDHYDTEDKVYYRRVDRSEWKGFEKVDTPQAVLEDERCQMEGREHQNTLPEPELSDIFDSENESQEEEASTNNKPSNVEDNADHPHTTEQPRQDEHGCPDTTGMHHIKTSDHLQRL